jgi:hypothetical protein
MQWPADIIKELLNEAQTKGHSEAELASPKEAELFRYAIKNYKRRNNTGENLTTNVVGKSVIIRRNAEIKIKGAA